MNKFKNNILIKNIFILLLSGTIAKIIGMLSKIIFTRYAGLNVVSLYTMITPTFMLIITLSQFSFPIAISKLSAENKFNDKFLLKNAITLGLIINIIIMSLTILFSKYIANMLHVNILYKAIIAIAFIIPFVTISSILRGFLHGKENMLAPSITNITEEIIKILLIIFTLPIAIEKSNISAVILIILYNIILEITSIIIMIKPVMKYIKNDASKNNIGIKKAIFNISFPTTMIRLISTFGYFLEPILLTNLLINAGFTTEYITIEYAVITSYIIPLLSTPSFFSISISSALLPNITKAYANKKYKEFSNKVLKLITISLIIGILCLGVIMLFPKTILNLIYGVTEGINYIYLIGPFFLILYMQPVLSMSLQAMGKTNKLFYVSLISTISKYIILTLFASNGYGINSLIFSIITGILITTGMILYIVLKDLNKKIGT